MHARVKRSRFFVARRVVRNVYVCGTDVCARANMYPEGTRIRGRGHQLWRINQTIVRICLSILFYTNGTATVSLEMCRVRVAVIECILGRAQFARRYARSLCYNILGVCIYL